MQTISMHGKVSDDGMLCLEVPLSRRGAEVDVVVVVQPNALHAGLSLAELAGAINDDTFVEPDELPFETREPIL